MNAMKAYRIFVSYTAEDLAAHADVVLSVLRKLQVIAVDHRDSGATGEPSVEWCMREIDKAHVVIVLLAHRYGWIPTADDGGDGEASITRLEVARARAEGKIILPYLVDEFTPWPPSRIEALQNPAILPQLNAFRTELTRSVAAFFTGPESLDGPVSRDVPRALERLTLSAAPPSRSEQQADEEHEREQRGQIEAALEAAREGRRDDARVHFINALSRCHQLRDGKRKRRLLGVLTTLLERSGFPSLALVTAGDAIELDQMLGDQRHLAEDMIALGNAYVRLGESDAAERAFVSSLKISTSNGHFANAASASTNLAGLLGNRGKMREALALLKMSMAYLDREPFPETELNTRITLLQVLDIERAEPELAIKTARVLFDRFGSQMHAAQREVAIASLERVVDRFLESRPELDAVRWKSEQFPEIDEWKQPPRQARI